MTGSEKTPPDPTPVFRFVHGRPTEEEIAAVVAVLTARTTAAPQPTAAAPASQWGAYWRSVGALPQPGPGRWQAAIRGW